MLPDKKWKYIPNLTEIIIDITIKLNMMLIFRPFLLITIWTLSSTLVFGQCNHIAIKRTKPGIYEVPVTINGKITIDFIFDTGCSTLFIAPDFFNTLRIRGGLDSSDYLRNVNLKNAQGITETCGVYRLDSITIGNTTIKNVDAVVSNSIRASMLLGQNVLSQFGKYLFDYKKPVLVLGDCKEKPQIYITKPTSNDTVNTNIEIKGQNLINSRNNYLIIEWFNERRIEPIRIINSDGIWSQNITLGDVSSTGIIYNITAVTSENEADENMQFSEHSYYSNSITLIRK